MTQVAAGKGWAGVALPVRVHDLLLALAGRLDDDALADARELLASAEIDRSLEMIAGCLVAGHVGIGTAEREELLALFGATYSDPGVVGRVRVAEPDLVTRHRFAAGKVDGIGPEEGVAEAASRVLEALPDIRAVWAVWRLTPAGAATGAVPHRVVLVGVGPTGSAAATAYRVETSLRRAGLTASVEVLRDGTEPTDYHHTAMRYATEVQVPRTPPAVVPKGNPVKASKKKIAEQWIPASEDIPPSAPPADDSLNDQELGLLRQLQEELARREQTDPTQPDWQGDLGAGGQPFDWHEANSSTMVNGLPLQPPESKHS
ncbi:hypothetical protein V5P93_000294 [Actinokineospora auranticolor]|uniref:Uncharacterized protein n=1 Tax=Actinokineospora auranticolor TaxID=155976 RepID=A0A2S6GKQ1_9PSEU|nr:hypothetical protein [Actinokineospora auranticolor]PPK65818.1 hypothetical protein CLV40_11279 [Actinokineospora auranticolor]